MFVIPVGSDATLRHQPFTTYIIAGLFALITLGTWIAYPSTILRGIPGLIAGEQERLEAAHTAAEEQTGKDIEAETQSAGHATARSLARDLDLVDEPLSGKSAAALAIAREELAEAAGKGWITPDDRTRLEAKLAACPTVSPEDGLAVMLGIDTQRPFMDSGQLKMGLEILKEPEVHGITAAQADALRIRLGKVRIVGDAYPGLYDRIDPGGKHPLTTDQIASIIVGIDFARHEGNLEAEEPDELKVLLAKRDGVSSAVAERTVASPDEVPWFLTTVGGLNPLRWLSAMCVHPRWFEALFGIGFTLSFGVVVEGLIGWRRFLPVLGGSIALTYLWSQLTGLFAPGILIQAGSAELRAILAGILVMWVPTNYINYNRWFIVSIGSFQIEIWKVVAFSTVAGLLGALFNGLPWMVGISGQLFFPLAGLGAGFLLLRPGWLPPGGWDLPLLWQTRALNPGDRSALIRERALQESGGMAAAAEAAIDSGPAADLTAETVTAVRESLAAGELDTAYSLWKAVRSTTPSWSTPSDLIDQLLKTFYQTKNHEATAAIAEELIRLYPERSRDARLILASQALAQGKPSSIRSHLDGIPAAQRTPAATAQIERLLAKAAELEAQGVREVEFI